LITTFIYYSILKCLLKLLLVSIIEILILVLKFDTELILQTAIKEGSKGVTLVVFLFFFPENLKIHQLNFYYYQT